MRTPGRHALAFIFITVLIDIIGFGIVIPVLPDLIVELTGDSLAQAAAHGGWLLFIYAVMQFFAAPLIGNLSDRFGRRPVLLAALAALSLDYLLMGFAPVLAWLFVGRIIAGITGATYTTANAYIADVTPPERRAQSFGLIGAAFGLGFIIGPVIGGLLGELGTRVPFFAAAGLALFNMLYGFIVLPETLSKENRRPFTLARATPAGALVQIRRYPVVLGLIGVVICYQLAHDANPAAWTYYTKLKFSWDRADVGLSLGFVGLMIAIVQGVLIRAAIPRLGELRAVYLGLACGAAGFVGFSFVTKGWMLFALIVPWALIGLAMPAMRSVMSRQVPADAQGELQGALTSVVSLTMIGAPVLMTQLFRYFASESAPVYFPGAPFFAAGMILLAAIGLFALAARRVRTPV